MMSMQFYCPHCKGLQYAPVTQVGMLVDCTQCKSKFVIPPLINPSTVYQEHMSYLRHCGTLRFAKLAMFLLATGSLVSAYANARKEPHLGLYAYIPIAGMGLAIMFAIFELSLNAVHSEHSKAVEYLLPRMDPDTHEPWWRRPYFHVVRCFTGIRKWYWGPITVSTLAFYAGVACFWWEELRRCVT